MSRTIILTFGSLATFSALALAQSPIEPPRRATPPTDASLLAPPTKGAVVLPGAAPAPSDSPPEATQTPAAPAIPAATDAAAAKPSVATGATPAALEAAKARAAEFKAKAAAAAAARAGAQGGAPAGGPPGGGPGALPGGLPGGANPGAVGGANPAGGPGPKPGVPMSAPATPDPFSPTGAQVSGAPSGKDQLLEISNNPTATVEDVIADYELNTGVTVIRANSITGGLVPVALNPAVKNITKDDYVDYLKATLMVNGYSIHEYAPKMHLITFTGQPTPLFGAVPSFKGNPVYTREIDLPARDEFVNYFMKFDNLTAADAATIIGQPQHQSGKVTPVPSAGGLLITESVPVIRSFLAIKKEVDIPGSIMENKFVQLKIADAEEVAGVVQQILQQQSAANSKAGAGAAGGNRLVSAPNAAQQLNTQLNPGQPNPAGTPAGTQAAPDSASIVVQADRRTNRILISGKKSDVAYIEKLIHEFDLPSEIENFVTYPLRFIRVTDFIELATSSLEARGFGASGGGTGGGASAGAAPGGAAAGGSRQASGNGYPTGGASGGTSTRSSQAATTSRSSSRSGGGGGGAAGGAGGVSGGGGGSRGGAGASAQNTMAIPSSTTVGKTLLISDPQSNAIIVSGTPEARDQVRILIQQMDKRPLQVHIDCVIAELSLGDNLDYGIDLLRKVDNLSLGGKSVDAGGIFRNTPSGADSSSTGIIDPAVLTALAGFPAGASGLNAYFSVGELVNGYIRASEGTSKVKVIQKPSFSTSNNEPAYISIGQQVPFPGQQQSYLNGTGGNTGGSVNTNVEYKDVVLSLDVTPLINSKEEVTLQIQQINDNVTGSTVINNNKIPIISQQELNTKLTVPNHGIAVIGGLIADRRDGSNNGAPILARIPIIRNLFGNTTKADSRRELMIFMQPSIMAGPDDMIEVNSREIARTIVGPDAEKFARPGVDMKDVIMPTAQGNIPYDSAGYPKEEKPGFWRSLFKRKTNVPADPAYPR